ncbi:hypothetical protein BDN67DRAFT_20383 [Paxillus ammoniavirescens]|nr:hypothetical protein BDN67DRAFT_20383 [Paxillus ammoniavirescens]
MRLRSVVAATVWTNAFSAFTSPVPGIKRISGLVDAPQPREQGQPCTPLPPMGSDTFNPGTLSHPGTIATSPIENLLSFGGLGNQVILVLGLSIITCPENLKLLTCIYRTYYVHS